MQAENDNRPTQIVLKEVDFKNQNEGQNLIWVTMTHQRVITYV